VRLSDGDGGRDGSRRVDWEDPSEGASGRTDRTPTGARSLHSTGGESRLQRSNVFVHNMLEITEEVVKLY
jgi:hypothetical protein